MVLAKQPQHFLAVRLLMLHSHCVAIRPPVGSREDGELPSDWMAVSSPSLAPDPGTQGSTQGSGWGQDLLRTSRFVGVVEVFLWHSALGLWRTRRNAEALRSNPQTPLEPSPRFLILTPRPCCIPLQSHLACSYTLLVLLRPH